MAAQGSASKRAYAAVAGDIPGPLHGKLRNALQEIPTPLLAGLKKALKAVQGYIEAPRRACLSLQRQRETREL